jgi:hypothetical protein
MKGKIVLLISSFFLAAVSSMFLALFLMLVRALPFSALLPFLGVSTVFLLFYYLYLANIK